jgi:hypothetical protein
VKRENREQWKAAQNLSDVRELTARWLTGELEEHPGYPGGPPDQETAPIADRLAEINRQGLLTTQSQPGHEGDDYAQSAWVQGLGAEEHVRELQRRVQDANMQARIAPPATEHRFHRTRFDDGTKGWSAGTVGDMAGPTISNGVLNEVMGQWQFEAQDPASCQETYLFDVMAQRDEDEA